MDYVRDLQPHPLYFLMQNWREKRENTQFFVEREIKFQGLQCVCLSVCLSIHFLFGLGESARSSVTQRDREGAACMRGMAQADCQATKKMMGVCIWISVIILQRKQNLREG